MHRAVGCCMPLHTSYVVLKTLNAAHCGTNSCNLHALEEHHQAMAKSRAQELQPSIWDRLHSMTSAHQGCCCCCCLQLFSNSDIGNLAKQQPPPDNYMDAVWGEAQPKNCLRPMGFDFRCFKQCCIDSVVL
jgi:hypothetical protein